MNLINSVAAHFKSGIRPYNGRRTSIEETELSIAIHVVRAFVIILKVLLGTPTF